MELLSRKAFSWPVIHMAPFGHSYFFNVITNAHLNEFDSRSQAVLIRAIIFIIC